MRRPKAFEAILVEAGFTPGQARNWDVQIERLRLSGEGSDYLAAALLRWRRSSVQGLVDKMMGVRHARAALADCPTLFG